MPGNRRNDRRRGPGSAANADFTADRVAARAERTAVFGKTKMCKFFILGVCAKGSECAFAHDASEMQASPDLSRTKICKTLINTGVCNDPECSYAHNKEELRTVPGVPTQLPREFQASSASSSFGASQKPIAGNSTKAHAAAASSGPSSFPMPSAADMLPMPMLAGQNLDPAQALAMQQWLLACQQMQIQQMAAQAQDGQARNTSPPGYSLQPPGSAAGQSFLYGALFGADGQQQQPQGAGGGSSSGAGGAPDQKKLSRKGVLNKQVSNKQVSKAVDDVCNACGAAWLRDAKYCRSCGALRGDASPVNYSVKNTFIDVPKVEEGSPLVRMKLSQSVPAHAGLYSLSAENTSPSPLSSQDAASLSFASPPFPSSDNTLNAASLAAAGAAPLPADEGHTLGFMKPMPRDNTWASNLDAVGEEEDLDVSTMPTQFAAPGGPSSEKRLQDTPLAHRAHAGAEQSQSAALDEGSLRGRAGSLNGEKDIEGASHQVSVRNTFIEIKQEPGVGMRKVQTMAGSLDSMMPNEEGF